MAHVKQALTINVPEALLDQLGNSHETVHGGSLNKPYLGGALHVYADEGSEKFPLGVLVYYPATSIRAMQGKV